MKSKRQGSRFFPSHFLFRTVLFSALTLFPGAPVLAAAENELQTVTTEPKDQAPVIQAEELSTTDSEPQSAPDSASQTTTTTHLSLLPEEKALSTEQLLALFGKVYRNKDWPKAQALAAEVLRREPKSSAALYNSGLVFAEMGQLGWGVARFRQALAIWPGFPEAYQGLIFLERKLKLNDSELSKALWFRLQDSGFRYLSLAQMAFFCLFLFGAAGFLFIKYLGRRRVAKITQEAPPAWPVWPAVFSVVFFFSICAAMIKWQLNRLEFGTVVLPKATALSAPSAAALSLFEVTEGQEVLIESVDQEFFQVLSPEGLSGWVKQGEVVESSL